MLVSVAAQKRGISPYKYIKTVTRGEFELDITGWLSSIFYPVGQIASGLSSEDGGKSSKRGRSLPRGAKDETSNRSRRSSQKYSWYRSSPGKSYNVYNLDSADPYDRARAVSQMRKDFASQGK